MATQSKAYCSVFFEKPSVHQRQKMQKQVIDSRDSVVEHADQFENSEVKLMS